MHEVKFDGYRILAFINEHHVILKSRNNKVWTNELTSIAKALKKLSINNVVLDGEVVMLDKEGKSDFQLLQNTIKAKDEADFIYYIFDILYYDRFDLRSLTLLERKEILKYLLTDQNHALRYSDHIIDHGNEVFQHACEFALEGIISKQVDSKYVSKRSKTWLKIKCSKRQEFIIGGYSPPKGGRDFFGALYLGVFNLKGELEYSGNVGTGFSAASLAEIYSQLAQLKIKQSPFRDHIPYSSSSTWVKPVLVAEIEFTEWTDEGHLRHPSFKGLRLDKLAKTVRREQELSLGKIKVMKNQDMNPKNTGSTVQKKIPFEITHPDKIIYPEDGITKKELLTYYDTVCDLMLPYIRNRVLSLVRCPEHYNHCFFQRHYKDSTPTQLKSIILEGKEKEEPYIYLNDREGLLSLVQMGVLEIHPWGSLINRIDKPDIIILDLDPDPDVTWDKIVDAAYEIKGHLENYNLTSFVKTTGGKGLHVVIPVKPEYDWEEVKNFTRVFVEFLEKNNPERYISKMSKEKRKGKIFVDYLRNQKGATSIGVYSTRARIHAPVSVPLHWEELSKDKHATEFTIKTLPMRLALLQRDPWEGFWDIKQSLRLNELK